MISRRFLALCLTAALLTGCSAQTVEEMYCLPKRSEAEGNLQSAIDSAMTGLSYSAPLTGENQQTVQMADLDGDGTVEYLLFAKGTDKQPMKVLIFRQEREAYVLAETVASYGSAFDQVEYVQMDDRPGMELVLGRQVSDQVQRSVSVYTFSSGQAEMLLTAGYTKYLCSDLDSDGFGELFLLRAGDTETGGGVAELYGMENGTLERYNEVGMSGPVDCLRRVITGNLSGGTPAVYAASAIKENALVTDIYTVVDGELRNVALDNTTGTDVHTLRSYYVYAEDIDNDGVVELPDLIEMRPLGETAGESQQRLIRWYAMSTTGAETDKRYTYHNYVGGWYLELEKQWALRMTVVPSGSDYEFYLWDEQGEEAALAFTISVFTGPERGIEAAGDGRFELYSGDTAIYTVQLEPPSGQMKVTAEGLAGAFHLIRQPWKTGET